MYLRSSGHKTDTFKYPMISVVPNKFYESTKNKPKERADYLPSQALKPEEVFFDQPRPSLKVPFFNSESQPPPPLQQGFYPYQHFGSYPGY